MLKQSFSMSSGHAQGHSHGLITASSTRSSPGPCRCLLRLLPLPAIRSRRSSFSSVRSPAVALHPLAEVKPPHPEAMVCLPLLPTNTGSCCRITLGSCPRADGSLGRDNHCLCRSTEVDERPLKYNSSQPRYRRIAGNGRALKEPLAAVASPSLRRSTRRPTQGQVLADQVADHPW